MNKPLHEFFTNDHRRIDRLLDASTQDPEAIDDEVYRQFRVGLLTHIKMEENTLFPAVKKANGGKMPEEVAQFRLEHAALTTLMALEPGREMLKVLRYILQKHDEAEEVPGGLYDICENLTKGETDRLLEQLRKTTETPVHAPKPASLVLGPTKRVLKRAGYDYDGIC